MRKEKTIKEILWNGILKENPTYVQFLGMCPTLAVTGSLNDALGMGVGVIFVLIMSNAIVSLIRKVVPNEVRIPVFIVVIAALVTLLEMFMKAFVPELAASLGIFLPLIVVNCIVLGRAEAFAAKNGVIKSIVDAFAMGIGFTIGIMSIAFVRELLGNGKLFGFEIYGFISNITNNIIQIPKAGILVLPAGAFLVFGLLLAQVNKFRMRRESEVQ